MSQTATPNFDHFLRDAIPEPQERNEFLRQLGLGTAKNPVDFYHNELMQCESNGFGISSIFDFI